LTLPIRFCRTSQPLTHLHGVVKFRCDVTSIEVTGFNRANADYTSNLATSSEKF
jgi:hypothetical protein